ncbi:MAG: FliM/FliN family flagellar motor switch protein [Candidatus Latescibacteria bacterium]|nr:FliM/FliN family flagellar motor switch protein [Candidatus Latescibacterota bacterium]
METAENGTLEKAALAHLGDIEVEAVVYLGRRTLKLAEALALRPGSVVVLPRLAGESFPILINGTPLGEGETALVSERMTYRITRLVPVEIQEVPR